MQYEPISRLQVVFGQRVDIQCLDRSGSANSAERPVVVVLDEDSIKRGVGEMVPPPDSNNPAVFRNLVNSIGAPGQNSPTPSEKLFGFHEFVKYSINGVIRYYDPSYGLEYANNVDFHNQAIAGYATGPRVDINPGFALYAVQKPNDNNGNPRVIIQIIP